MFVSPLVLCLQLWLVCRLALFTFVLSLCLSVSVYISVKNMCAFLYSLSACLPVRLAFCFPRVCLLAYLPYFFTIKRQ
jgi:hypothetical protein